MLGDEVYVAVITGVSVGIFVLVGNVVSVAIGGLAGSGVETVVQENNNVQKRQKYKRDILNALILLFPVIELWYLASRQVLQPLASLVSCFTNLHWPSPPANKHNHRANRPNNKSRRADHSDDQIQGIHGGALYQILERPRGCWILGDRIEKDVQDNEENKTDYRRQEEKQERLCASPGVDECQHKGNRREIRQQNAGRIIVNADGDRGNRQQAAERQEDEGFVSVAWG